MQTIEIDDDVYRHLKDASKLGEGISPLMRRLLKISHPGVGGSTASTAEGTGQPATAVEPRRIDEALQDRRFKVGRTAVDRFLFLLAWLNSKHPDTFKEVLTLGGRSRSYFALSKRELEAAGTSVNPRQVPGTEFWVVTNNDTRTKEGILFDVLALLGYGPMDVAAVKGRLSASPTLDDIV